MDFSIEEMSQRYGEDNLLQLPCGHCPACLSRKSKEWAVRCCLESKQWKENCFVTLTYDEKNYPGIGKKKIYKILLSPSVIVDIKFVTSLVVSEERLSEDITIT